MSPHALHILMTGVPELLGRLESGYFRRAGVRITTAASVSELPRLVPQLLPDVVILAGGVLDPALEAMVARRIRTQLGTGRLLLALPAEGAGERRDLSLFDDVLPLADPELALTRTLAPLAAAPARHAARARVAVPALLCPVHGPHVPATALDLSDSGAGLIARATPVGGEVLTLLFHRADGRKVGVGGAVVWSTEPLPGIARLGVRFVDEARGSLRALQDLAFWEIVHTDAGSSIHLYGVLDAARDLGHLARAALLVPRLDLEAVTLGVGGTTRWLGFLNGLPPGVSLRLRRTPAALTRAMRAAGLVGERVVLESSYLTYRCRSCQVEVIELEPTYPPPPPPDCPECEAPMVLEDPEAATAPRSA